ncbi:MAG: hypothetical protein PHS88_06100 [Candidatus Omnitrophica bacterium]|nr:hypothetical protein [Candidatus Omnitrophota bacterium]
MKKWGLAVAGLYGLLLLILTWPVVKIALMQHKETINAANLFTAWQYWVWLVVFVVGQYLFLAVPVDLADKRPVSKRSLIFQIMASSLMLGILVGGCAISVGEAIKKELVSMWVFWSALGISWVFWSVVFLRWRLKADPKVFLEKQCRFLFRGSILELLVAVPTHILARGRGYCCAGFETVIGISCGIAVMLFSFGPGIYFLYVDRWAKLHPKGTGQASQTQDS